MTLRRFDVAADDAPVVLFWVAYVRVNSHGRTECKAVMLLIGRVATIAAFVIFIAAVGCVPSYKGYQWALEMEFAEWFNIITSTFELSMMEAALQGRPRSTCHRPRQNRRCGAPPYMPLYQMARTNRLQSP